MNRPLIAHTTVLNRGGELTVLGWCSCGYTVSSHTEEACLRLLRRKHAKNQKGNQR
jgi:hypothetical protein